MNLRRGIVIQSTDRAHDDGVRPLGTNIVDHLFHVGLEKILGTIIVIIDTELDDNIITRLQFFGNAVPVGTALLEEHIVITDCGIAVFILAATTQRHAALATVHDRSLGRVEPEMEILALSLLGVITGIPVLHGGITTQIDGHLRPRERGDDHRCNNGRLPDFSDYIHNIPYPIYDSAHILYKPFCLRLPSNLTFTTYTPFGSIPFSSARTDSPADTLPEREQRRLPERS